MRKALSTQIIDTIHPEHERSLTIREALHLMGFPDDFELLDGLKKMNHIAQNVPVVTSRDMHAEIAKFLTGDLEISDTTYLRQNNFKQLFEFDPKGKDTTPNLEEFFE